MSEVIKAKVEALEPVITEINDTVAIIRTKVGTLPADLAAIANMPCKQQCHADDNIW